MKTIFSKKFVIMTLIWIICLGIIGDSFGGSLQIVHNWWYLVPLGIITAIIANLTAVGGGIVLFPALIFIEGILKKTNGGNITDNTTLIHTALAYAFAVESVGLSAGAIKYATKRIFNFKLFFIAAPISIIGAIIAQVYMQEYVDKAEYIFACFCIIMAGILLARYFYFNEKNKGQYKSNSSDIPMFIILIIVIFTIPGGIFTRLISVGAGATVLLPLLMYGANRKKAVGTSVAVLAITAVISTGFEWSYIPWQKWVMTAPGVFIGSQIAVWLQNKIKQAYFLIFCNLVLLAEAGIIFHYRLGTEVPIWATLGIFCGLGLWLMHAIYNGRDKK